MKLFKQYVAESSASRREANEGREKIPVPEGSPVKIRLIKNAAAAKAYGAGTNWCTKDSEKAKQYLKSGPLINIEYGGEKYQIHSSSNELTDSSNRTKKFSELHPDIHKAMAASSHPAIQHANFIFNNPEISQQQHQETAEFHTEKGTKDEATIFRSLDFSDVAGKYVNHKSSFIRQQVARRYPEHAAKMVNDPDWAVRAKVAAHPEHLGKFVNDPDDRIRARVALSPEYAHMLTNDPDDFVRWRAYDTIKRHIEKTGTRTQKILHRLVGKKFSIQPNNRKK